MLKRSALVVLLLMVALLAVPTFAAPVPSKTAANQSLATRDADLALVRDVAANEQVAKVLAAVCRNTLAVPNRSTAAMSGN